MALLRRYRPVHLLATLITAVLAAQAGWLLLTGGQVSWPRGVLDAVLIVLSVGALYWRRRWPVPVAVLVLLCAGVYYPASPYDSPLPTLAFVVALFTVAAAGQLAAAVALAVVVMLAIGYGETLLGPENRQVDNTAMFLLAGWLFGVVAVGHAARVAEREKEARARQSATEERLRVAREVHDVLGHNISLINVQSGAALHRYAKDPTDPERVAALAAAMESVRDTSRDALRELRATLGALRQADETAPTGPAPGLDRVDELAERARATGLAVRVQVTGERRALPAPVSLAAYRIVQESLTNVVRHAQARSAVVTVEYGRDDVRVSIEDDGRGAAEDTGVGGTGGGSGSGVAGMAERARALGGELTTGNTDTGHRVAARLPLAGDDA